MRSVPLGLTGRAESTVTEQRTSDAMGSGSVPVLATPYMTALMEQAAYTSLSPYLDADQSSVGTRLDITHNSATPVGMDIWAESEVTAVDGKKITFRIKAYDRSGPIGEGYHERVVITSGRFLERCYTKLEVSEHVH